MNGSQNHYAEGGKARQRVLWEIQGGVSWGEITKGTRKLLGVAVYTHYIDCGNNSWRMYTRVCIRVCIYIYTCQNKLYTLNMCDLLYISYISLKWFYKHFSNNLVVEFNFIFLAFLSRSDEFNDAQWKPAVSQTKQNAADITLLWWGDPISEYFKLYLSFTKNNNNS